VVVLVITNLTKEENVFERLKLWGLELWRWFRRRSVFAQMLLVVPTVCAVALTVFVGNMGLALMGMGIALYAPVVGWLFGMLAVVLAKATSIIV
jgi:hypothetical protein